MKKKSRSQQELKNQTKSDIHENFLDLKPIYQQMKFKRAYDLAQHWLKIIGFKLLNMVKEQARKNFRERIESGSRLSYEEIQMLNTLHKGDYIKFMLSEDDKNTKIINEVNQTCLEKHDELSEVIWSIHDFKDQWQTSINSINAAIKQKALDLGIIKDLKFKFEEFEIQDMYEYHDGKMCTKCRRHLKCDQHQLKRQSVLI